MLGSETRICLVWCGVEQNHVYYSKPLSPEGVEASHDVAAEGQDMNSTGAVEGARDKPTRAEEGPRQTKTEGKGQTLPPPKLLRWAIGGLRAIGGGRSRSIYMAHCILGGDMGCACVLYLLIYESVVLFCGVL